MKITEADVNRVAELANLNLGLEERQRMLRDLNRVLDYIDQLNQADTSNVPVTQDAAPFSSQESKLRSDEIQPSLSREQALRNAPQSDGTYFEVPKVIER